MKTKKQKMKDLQSVRKHKLMIQKLTTTQDEFGNEIEEWNDWKSVTAERLELFGSDYYSAKQLGEEQTIKWKIKYVSFVEKINTAKYRVINIRTDEIYDIKDTDYLQDDGQWLIIKAEKSGELNV
ncbi:MAG: putative phage head-tail adaptor [Candidatus Frackibacter sp. T328-2]|nr:MAG: putative phage head-tail adaptor [Candidatus Frackibacter sp. T328-2]